ncbi:DUF3885 domain-containing protein [Peribacillus asahii]|nr:DUF3885 domain-containing protein [Peribacillus asahii]
MYFVYDDRGYETIANGREVICPLYEKYYDWIDDYCREEIEFCEPIWFIGNYKVVLCFFQISVISSHDKGGRLLNSITIKKYIQ